MPLTEAQRREDCTGSYYACIRQLRLQGIREGRYAPIPDDPEELAAAREAKDAA